GTARVRSMSVHCRPFPAKWLALKRGEERFPLGVVVRVADHDAQRRHLSIAASTRLLAIESILIPDPLTRRFRGCIINFDEIDNISRIVGLHEDTGFSSSR